MMRIDIDAVLRQRLPRHYKYIPHCVVRWLEKTVCQDRLNELLAHNAHLQGVTFARAVLADMGITASVTGTIPSPVNKRVVLVSNHPLGGLDGLVLSTVAADIYGEDPSPLFVVNDLLAAVEPLRPIFLGVNKHGSQSRSAARAIDQAFDAESPILMFPAGLVSRRHSDGTISDLEWHKMAVVRAIASRRDIIPVHFSGNNSRFFYNFARIRSRLGLRLNIEMVCLPREMILSQGSHYTVTLGAPVPWQSLQGGLKAHSQAQQLRRLVYDLAPSTSPHMP